MPDIRLLNSHVCVRERESVCAVMTLLSRYSNPKRRNTPNPGVQLPTHTTLLPSWRSWTWIIQETSDFYHKFKYECSVSPRGKRSNKYMWNAKTAFYWCVHSNTDVHKILEMTWIIWLVKYSKTRVLCAGSACFSSQLCFSDFGSNL